MKRHQYRGDALLEVLHTAQELFGFLSNDLMRKIARGLKQPPSRVYGVATFYNFFTLKPQGIHTCALCMGTACYVKGADRGQKSLEERLGVVAGQTRADGKATLRIARCLGACGLAPAAVFDGTVVGTLDAPKALKQVEEWLNGTA